MTMLRRALARLTSLVSEDLTPAPLVLVDFTKPGSTKGWRVHSDAPFGGNSAGHLREDESQQGVYSRVLKDDSELVRAGYVGISTFLPRNMNLSMHDYLEFRLRWHAPQAYMASLRMEQLSRANGEEAWQAPLIPSRTGEWQDVQVPLSSMVFTFRGRMSSTGRSSLTRPERTAVQGLSIMFTATEDMPEEDNFRLDIAHIKAVASSSLSPEEAAAKMQLQDISPERRAELEAERQALEAARQLHIPGGRKEQ